MSKISREASQDFWAFTIVYNPNGLTDEELIIRYNTILDYWRRCGVDITSMVFENKTKHGRPTKLHAHGRCEIAPGTYRKKLQLKNYHVKLVSIYDGPTWTQYIEKNNEDVNPDINPDGCLFKR